MSLRQRWLLSSRAMRDPPSRTGDCGRRNADGLTIWSSVLRWLASGAQDPRNGASHDDRVSAAIRSLRTCAPAGSLLWGGDWNHSLDSRVIGSRRGRNAIIELADSLVLQVPTTCLPHQRGTGRSIDHIAVPASWEIRDCWNVPTFAKSTNLSDHDLYVVEVEQR